MIKISGHHINPQHVSAVYVVQPKTRKERKHWRRYEIEIVMLSGYKFLDWGRGTDDIREVEDWANNLAKYIADAARQELVEATMETMKIAAKVATES